MNITEVTVLHQIQINGPIKAVDISRAITNSPKNKSMVNCILYKLAEHGLVKRSISNPPVWFIDCK